MQIPCQDLKDAYRWCAFAIERYEIHAKVRFVNHSTMLIDTAHFFSSSFSLLLQTHFNVPCLVLHNSLILERSTEFRDKKIFISKEAN